MVKFIESWALQIPSNVRMTFELTTYLIKIWTQTCERDIANVVQQKLAVGN